MSKIIAWCYRLAWSNPYTEPPNGEPRIRREIFLPSGDHGAPPPPPELTEGHKPGDGWAVCVADIEEMPQELPRETLATVRRKRLKRRLAAKVPMFAPQFEAEEMQKKPAYYDGITDPDIAAGRAEALAAKAAVIARAKAALGIEP